MAEPEQSPPEAGLPPCTHTTDDKLGSVDFLLSATCTHHTGRGTCSLPLATLFMTYEGDYGSGPGLRFFGSCDRHVRSVRREAVAANVDWLGVGQVNAGDLGDLSKWLHGPWRLCETHKLTVVRT